MLINYVIQSYSFCSNITIIWQRDILQRKLLQGKFLKGKVLQGKVSEENFQTGFVVAGFLSYCNHQLIKIEEEKRFGLLKQVISVPNHIPTVLSTIYIRDEMK